MTVSPTWPGLLGINRDVKLNNGRLNGPLKRKAKQMKVNQWSLRGENSPPRAKCAGGPVGNTPNSGVASFRRRFYKF